MKIDYQTLNLKVQDHLAGEEESEFPNSLGMSKVGAPCVRSLWYSFNYCDKSKFKNRIKLILNRGTYEEKNIISLLEKIGLTIISPHDGKNSKDSFKYAILGGKIKGVLDGIITHGVPEAPEKAHVLEIKTMNSSNFKDMEKNGLQKSKIEHFVQLQLYMHVSEIDRGIYVAINKNTDEIYVERVKYSKSICEMYLSRANQVVNENQPPKRLTEDSSFFQCKMCSFVEVCHGNKLPLANCRTCDFFDIKTGVCGYWTKQKSEEKKPDINTQKKGCSKHVYKKSLMSTLLDSETVVNIDESNYKISVKGKYINIGHDNLTTNDIKTLPLEILKEGAIADFQESFGNVHVAD